MYIVNYVTEILRDGIIIIYIYIYIYTHAHIHTYIYYNPKTFLQNSIPIKISYYSNPRTKTIRLRICYTEFIIYLQETI